MKRLAILALAALLLVPVSVNAQRKNENLGKKYGPYEVKIGKGKYMKDAPVTAIWNNETKVWVTSPIIDKKNGAMFFLPTTDVEFIEGEDYPAEAQGLVNIDWAFCWAKGLENPKQKWLCNGECGHWNGPMPGRPGTAFSNLSLVMPSSSAFSVKRTKKPTPFLTWTVSVCTTT